MKKRMSMQWVHAGAWLFMAAATCAQDVKPATPAPAPIAADQAASGQVAAGAARAKAARATNTAQQEAGEPRAATSAMPSAGARPRSKNATDHVELDTTTVTGNRELPKVMYVVPWKRSDIGDLIGRPANSLLDEVLAPVDRSVFRREVQYYQALRPDTAPEKATSAQGEK